jgi:hypothetical protein
MIYKFRSKATGDVLMLGPQGDQCLRILGREPAVRGILEPAAMDAALQALQQAVAEDERLRQGEGPGDVSVEQEAAAQAAGRDPVSLHRRLWPMVEMIRRAQAAGEPIVWGA